MNNTENTFTLSREQLLADLYRAYQRARRHKAASADRQRFELHLEDELTSLAGELHARTYRPSPSVCFVIEDPKRREVFAADFRDRVVHHLYYDYTHRLFERTFIADTYSCIEGRGTHYGIRRLQRHILAVSDRYRRPCYVLKVDVKGYFMHIDRRRLLALCLRTLEKMRGRAIDGSEPWDTTHDYAFVRYLTETFVLYDPLPSCRRHGSPDDWKGLPPSKSLFCSPPGCGLPIGNLTSQLFSNVYMNAFDQHCKRRLGCRHYGRYVDDAFVVSGDREWLRGLVPQMAAFLERELGLQLHPGKTRIDDCRTGVAFLGAYLKPWRSYVHSATVRRIRRKVRASAPLQADPRRLASSMSSFAGVFAHRQGQSVRKRALCASSPDLLRMGFFTKGMKSFKLYGSVFRAWREGLEE